MGWVVIYFLSECEGNWGGRVTVLGRLCLPAVADARIEGVK